MTNEELQYLNVQFNEQLQQQIDGTLRPGHVYKLGNPSEILIRAGLPDDPIEMASRRLVDKSLQSNHPFPLLELMNLVMAIQDPLIVFRSATHYGSYVLLTELCHSGKNFVVAIETNRTQGKMRVNSIRSIHYKDNPLNIINWIVENLADYIRSDFYEKWFVPIKNELLSKPQSNSVDVRKQLISAAKIVNNSETAKDS
ncbi:MAG: hypothetical protein IJ868_07225 [Prevotella sp.]|nr:hypothetical protein [Prevotella sp.]